VAGVLALAPALVAQPPAAPAPSAVYLEQIQLTGIGQDLYDAVTPSVQYVVGGVSYLINFVPVIGGPIAAQVNINYFQGIQPVVAATVDYLAGVVQDPLNVVPLTRVYGQTLGGIGSNYVSAQLRFLGLQPPAPLPPASVGARASRTANTGKKPAAVVAGVPRGQSRTGTGPARSASRAGVATAAKRFG
jgi:hypothetical protein